MAWPKSFWVGIFLKGCLAILIVNIGREPEGLGWWPIVNIGRGLIVNIGGRTDGMGRGRAARSGAGLLAGWCGASQGLFWGAGHSCEAVRAWTA